MQTRMIITAVVLVLALPVTATAQRRQPAAHALPSAIETAIAKSFPDERLPEPKAQWRARLAQDDVMRVCSRYRGKPPKRVAAAIQRAARSTIKLPEDGVLLGDWRRGERIAQDGYGLRFTDSDASRPNGGNCYACHQINRAESSYGTLGPSLLGYGRLHDYSTETARKVYEHIVNPHVHTPCAGMPRFGAAGILTPEQIKDLVALLMARDSPVNR